MKKIFNPRPTDAYVSSIDVFLEQYDKNHPEEKYAERERIKHEKIAHYRDNKIKSTLEDKIWKEF